MKEVDKDEVYNSVGLHPHEKVNEAITKKIGLHINYSKEDVVIPFCLVKQKKKVNKVSNLSATACLIKHASANKIVLNKEKEQNS